MTAPVSSDWLPGVRHSSLEWQQIVPPLNYPKRLPVWWQDHLIPEGKKRLGWDSLMSLSHWETESWPLSKCSPASLLSAKINHWTCCIYNWNWIAFHYVLLVGSCLFSPFITFIHLVDDFIPALPVNQTHPLVVSSTILNYLQKFSWNFPQILANNLNVFLFHRHLFLFQGNIWINQAKPLHE